MAAACTWMAAPPSRTRWFYRTRPAGTAAACTCKPGASDVNGGVFSNNRAVNGNGGAINLNGSLSLSGTLIVSNTAINGGGVQQWNTAPTVADHQHAL